MLAREYEALRDEAEGGRTEVIEGLTKEASTFYDFVIQIAFEGGDVAPADRTRLKNLIARIVEILQDTIGIIEFWKKPIEVKKLRGNIDTEILLADIPQLLTKHERIAVEIVKLAEKRNNELIR